MVLGDRLRTEMLIAGMLEVTRMSCTATDMSESSAAAIAGVSAISVAPARSEVRIFMANLPGG
jgi:hypothetical protein